MCDWKGGKGKLLNIPQPVQVKTVRCVGIFNKVNVS